LAAGRFSGPESSYTSRDFFLDELYDIATAQGDDLRRFVFPTTISPEFRASLQFVMSPVFLFVMSSSPLEKAGAVTSGQLEQNLNQPSPGNLYNGQPPPPGTKFRYYQILLVDDPLYYEFIGWLVDWEGDSGKEEWHSLYRDVEGLLHYCVDKAVVNPSDVQALFVIIYADYWACGKSLEEIVAKMREEFGTEAVYIPTFLRSPPEIETMHEITGYDS
jgi:hypothetical protein